MKRVESELLAEEEDSDSDTSSANLPPSRCRCASGLGQAAGRNPPPRIVFPTSPLVGLDLSKEDTVKAYSAWQKSQVNKEERKESYSMVEELTLEYFFDLDMIAINQHILSLICNILSNLFSLLSDESLVKTQA